VQYSYIPTVTFTDDDGSQRQEKLIEWKDERAAEELVEWLSERLRIEQRSEVGGANNNDPGGPAW
jgi:translation initiation factor 2 alpha subunit (eIF-2alpha)